MDYEDFGNVVRQFDQTTSRLPVEIPIIDDDILEDVENFFGQLTTSETFVDLNPAMTEIDIIEVNDGKYLCTTMFYGHPTHWVERDAYSGTPKCEHPEIRTSGC